MTALLASGVSKAPRRFWINHGATARPRSDDTVSTRDPGGNLEGLVSCGTSACAAARSVAARPSQRTSSRWTSHGPASVNAAHARSAPAAWAVVEPEAVDMTSRMPETWGNQHRRGWRNRESSGTSIVPKQGHERDLLHYRRSLCAVGLCCGPLPETSSPASRDCSSSRLIAARRGAAANIGYGRTPLQRARYSADCDRRS